MLQNLEYMDLPGSDLKFAGVMLADDLRGKEDELAKRSKAEWH
jgi:hypothetical protein